MCPLLQLEGFRMTHRLRSIRCSGCSGRRKPPLFICLLGQEQLARYTRAFGLSVQALTSGGEREGVGGSRRKEIHSSKKRQGGSNCRLPCAGETKAFIAFVLLIYKWDTLHYWCSDGSAVLSWVATCVLLLHMGRMAFLAEWKLFACCQLQGWVNWMQRLIQPVRCYPRLCWSRLPSQAAL